MPFTNLDAEGRARMVDVGDKPVTRRTAIAEAVVRMRISTREALANQALPKGDALVVAQTAGILAAKKTAELIPLCHTLPLDQVDIGFVLPDPEPEERLARVVIQATARTMARTGVELEALTAVTIAALTLYDMCKALDKGISIDRIRLLQKSGGRSGTYTAPDA